MARIFVGLLSGLALLLAPGCGGEAAGPGGDVSADVGEGDSVEPEGDGAALDTVAPAEVEPGDAADGDTGEESSPEDVEAGEVEDGSGHEDGVGSDAEPTDTADAGEIHEPICEVFVCDVLACGPDGCGGSCGDCGEHAICSIYQQCVPGEGFCGDGLVGPDETCDPGPDGPVVGCNPQCQVHFGFTCEGEPSVCVPRDLEEDGTLCSRPIHLRGQKFYAHLSLAGQFNSYHPFYGDCLAEDGFPTSSFGPDLTFAIDLGAGETLIAQVRSNVVPVTLAFATACGNDDPTDYVLNQSCVAITIHDTLGVWGSLSWTAAEHTTVYIVTGTPSSMASGPFELAVSVE